MRGIPAVNLIVIDEAARIDDELMAESRPMMATGGQPVRLSTPAGKRGWFYERRMMASAGTASASIE